VLPIGKQINLMHVADHGMISSSNIKKDLFLDYLKPSWLEYVAVINPVMSIRTRLDNQDSISKALNKVPDRFYYGTNARTLDFVIEAKKGYSLEENRMQKIKGGTHGYDARVKDVHAIF
jgi:hypothetical protein